MNEINLQLIQKDTKTWPITIARQDGTHPNISGWVIKFSIKTDFNDLDESAIFLKSVTLPSNVESENGIGYLHLTSSETDIVLGEYYYDMKFIATGYRETFIRGKLNIIPTILKA